MYCKTIILSNSKNLTNSPKGILTFLNENITKGKIRLYNSPNLPPNTKLGIYIDEKVHLCNLIKKPQHYEFSLDVKLDISKAIYCAIIDNSKGDKQVLFEGGSFNGFYFTDTPLDAVIEAKDDDIEKIIDNAIVEADKCSDCNNCANCEYKKYFYETQTPLYNENTIPSVENTKIHTNLTVNENQAEDNLPNTEDNLDKIKTSTPENKESKFSNKSNNDCIIEEDKTYSKSFENDKEDKNIQDNITAESLSNNAVNSLKTPTETNLNDNDISCTEQQTFLNEISSQLDEMFKIYPEDDMLNSIIPESRFIKVDNTEQSYVLGVIYEDKMMKYLAYGVPATYNSLPPADLGNNYQWLPINPKDVMSDGYFMIYQNALTGNIVDLTVE